MKERRSLQIKDKVFKKTDLINLANIFSKEQVNSQSAKHHSQLSFSVHCIDDTSYESESPDLLEDGGIVDIKQVTSFDIEYWDFTVERHATLSLSPGGNYSFNKFSVSGLEGNWVNGVFTRLKEILDNVTPQDNWLIRHVFLFYSFLAIAIGYLMLRTLIIALEVLRWSQPATPSNPDDTTRFLMANPIIVWAILIAFMWFIGFLPADAIGKRVIDLWPAIEFDLGPEHLKLQKLRRRGIVVVCTVFVAPFGVAIAYDILKSLLTR